MLLTLQTTHEPATDLGYLLHKNPSRVHRVACSFGEALCVYPIAEPARCQAAVAVDVDTIGLMRKDRPRDATPSLEHYVNDRPYVASSFLSVAIAELFSTAMSGRSKERPELVDRALPLVAALPTVSCRGGESIVRRLFEPLGYSVTISRLPLDEQFPEWGDSRLFRLSLACTRPLKELLTHLYVLLPVLDDEKHYWVGDSEVEKLLQRGGDWLPAHPERELIVRRYLRHKSPLMRSALAKLAEFDANDPDELAHRNDAAEEAVERPIRLHDERLAAVRDALVLAGAKSVLDLGCGEGRLLRELLKVRQFDRIVGMDVSMFALRRAAQRLHLEEMSERQRARIELLHGSLTYRDQRLSGFDGAAVVEVIEHLDAPRLRAFERAVFECARPNHVFVTTPNREYNVVWETLPAGRFRHADHRFEWSRHEFEEWARRVAVEFGYEVSFAPIGPSHESLGSPTQMGLFHR